MLLTPPETAVRVMLTYCCWAALPSSVSSELTGPLGTYRNTFYLFYFLLHSAARYDSVVKCIMNTCFIFFLMVEDYFEKKKKEISCLTRICFFYSGFIHCAMGFFLFFLSAFPLKNWRQKNKTKNPAYIMDMLCYQ